jgi:hypothetical protein
VIFAVFPRDKRRRPPSPWSRPKPSLSSLSPFLLFCFFVFCCGAWTGLIAWITGTEGNWLGLFALAGATSWADLRLVPAYRAKRRSFLIDCALIDCAGEIRLVDLAQGSARDKGIIRGPPLAPPPPPSLTLSLSLRRLDGPTLFRLSAVISRALDAPMNYFQFLRDTLLGTISRRYQTLRRWTI